MVRKPCLRDVTCGRKTKLNLHLPLPGEEGDSEQMDQ